MKNVWTINSNETATLVFSGTKAECQRYIIGRWGHWPPFAVISEIISEEKFWRKYGY